MSFLLGHSCFLQPLTVQKYLGVESGNRPRGRLGGSLWCPGGASAAAGSEQLARPALSLLSAPAALGDQDVSNTAGSCRDVMLERAPLPAHPVCMGQSLGGGRRTWTRGLPSGIGPWVAEAAASLSPHLSHLLLILHLQWAPLM